MKNKIDRDPLLCQKSERKPSYVETAGKTTNKTTASQFTALCSFV